MNTLGVFNLSQNAVLKKILKIIQAVKLPDLPICAFGQYDVVA